MHLNVSILNNNNLKYNAENILCLSIFHIFLAGNFKEKLLDEEAKFQPWVISYCGAPDGEFYIDLIPV